VTQELLFIRVYLHPLPDRYYPFRTSYFYCCNMQSRTNWHNSNI